MTKPRRNHYRVLFPNGEYQMGANRWKDAVQRKLLVRLSDTVAEVAEGVTVSFEGGEFHLRRAVTVTPWVLTNWLLIQWKNPAPTQ